MAFTTTVDLSEAIFDDPESQRNVEQLIFKNISFDGDIEPFPKIIQKYIQNLVDLTKENNGMYLTLALNYGGRAEIVRATKRIGLKLQQKKLSLEQIDEEIFSQNLDNGKEASEPVCNNHLKSEIFHRSFIHLL